MCPLRHTHVEVSIDGQDYVGTYTLSGRGDDLLSVTSGENTREANVGGLPPEFVARRVLTEMARDGAAARRPTR
jgi:hypothetical protein